MLRDPSADTSQAARVLGSQPDHLKLKATYYDAATSQNIPYLPRRIRLGLIVSLLAGWFSGLLGVGGGIVKVPVMNSLMKVPTKVATATSNFMIGITAATGATVYFLGGFVNASIVAPVALGVLAGAAFGSRISPRIRSRYIRAAFVIILAYTAVRLIAGALGIQIGI
jgi:hypothetical protein